MRSSLQHHASLKPAKFTFTTYRARRHAGAVSAMLLRDVPATSIEATVTQRDGATPAPLELPAASLPAVSPPDDQDNIYVPARSLMRRTTPVTVATLKDVRTMFKSLLQEYAYWVDEAWVTGTIPPQLHGTYYRNGPALHVTNPRYKRHTLDGDGMVFSLAFRGGRAYFRNRFVRTKGFLEEQAAGRPLYRNSFTRGSNDGSTAWFNPLDLSFKNVANTGVLPWAGKLYALWEAGLPYQMEPASLDTLGESRMGGQIRSNTFAAHYRVIVSEPHQQQPHHRHWQNRSPCTAAVGRPAAGASAEQQRQAQEWPGAGGAAAAAAAAVRVVGSNSGDCDGSGGRRLVTFSNEFGYGGASAVFYEFDAAGRLLHETKHPLPGDDIALLHDMVVTAHYYVLVVGAVRLDPLKFVTQYAVGLCSIAEVMVFDPRRCTRIMLFPRPGGPKGKVLAPRTLTTDPLFVFHNVNGWEAAEEAEAAEKGAAGGEPATLTLDCVTWDEVSFDMALFDEHKPRVEGFTGGARTQLTRLTCDLRTGVVQRRKLLRRTVEFPMTDPRVTSRLHRVAWFVADAVDHPVLWGPAQGIVRVEVDPHLTTSSPGCGGGGGAAATGPRWLAPPRPAPNAVCGDAAGAAPGVAVDSWFFGDRAFPGEPMFVPRPASVREGDGWLIVAVHNADTEKADVHIFDAEALSAGPLATLHLPHRLPVSLHGAWEDVYRGPDPEDVAVPCWQHLGSARPL